MPKYKESDAKFEKPDGELIENAFSTVREPATISNESALQDRCLIGAALATSVNEIEHHQFAQSFGPSILPARHARGAQDGFRIPRDRLETRAFLRGLAPESPGIYGYFDRNGRLNYVGKSKCLKKRLLSYFSKTPTDPKVARIVQHSRFVRWEPISHELLALIREQELITRWRPSFNSQGQPQRRQPAFLCVSDRAAPHVFVTTKISTRTRNGFGPIRGSGRLRQAAENLNAAFRLRDCNDQTPMNFADQLALFPMQFPAGCLRFETGSCSGPCTGTLAQSDYGQQVRDLMNFMNGYDARVLEHSLHEMELASKRQAFEKAMVLRDRYQSLSWLNNRLDDLRRSRYELNCIYPVTGFRRRKIWLCMTGGLLSAVVAIPQSRTAASKAMSLLQTANTTNPHVLPHDTPTVLMQLILISWFRKNEDEKSRLLPYPQALNLCEDLMK